MHDHQFKKLLDRFDYSWAGYRKVRKGVKKRITRHMQASGCRNMEAYLSLLDRDHAARDECAKRLTVSISRFFRDRSLWIGLEQEILPFLIEMKTEVVRVWSAGCACGEEVYSLKMVWEGLRPTHGHLPQMALTATDMVEEYIEKARIGSYPLSSLREVPEAIRKACFTACERGHRVTVKPALKGGIDWQVRHLFAGPPAYGFHLIFLRNNLLTYYRDHLKKAVFRKISDSLVCGGWLIVGAHEKLPEEAADFIRHASIAWAYQKRPDAPVPAASPSV